jgi:hypothetical protein
MSGLNASKVLEALFEMESEADDNLSDDELINNEIELEDFSLDEIEGDDDNFPQLVRSETFTLSSESPEREKLFSIIQKILFGIQNPKKKIILLIFLSPFFRHLRHLVQQLLIFLI